MSRVLIIAEAGVNHNGDIDLAKKLILAAADAGADYVKFQTFRADKLVSKDAKKARYQQKNIGGKDESQFNMLKQLELSEEQHYVLQDFANLNKIKFLSTGFDLDSVDFLNLMGMDFFKIPSGEVNNYQYLKRIALKLKPVVLSTGMCNLFEVESAVEVLKKYGLKDEMITVLHCNTEYPTPFADVNLKAMINMGRTLDLKYGYSDHTLGIEVPIAAVALGALVIEKHFTLDRKLPGPDHKASLEPSELKQMVDSIRNVELALSGNGIKEASASEVKNKPFGRKSIFLSRDMKKGELIEEFDLIMKRPGDGLSPMLLNDIINKRVSRDLSAEHKLAKDDFE